MSESKSSETPAVAGVSSGGGRKKRTSYGYRVWATGKTWACHAWSPYEWARSHRFSSQREAEWWGLDAIEEFGRNDSARGPGSGE